MTTEDAEGHTDRSTASPAEALARTMFIGYLRLVGDLFANGGRVAGTHIDADGYLRYDRLGPEPPERDTDGG